MYDTYLLTNFTYSLLMGLAIELFT